MSNQCCIMDSNHGRIFNKCMDIKEEDFRKMLVLPGHITEDKLILAVVESGKKGISISEQLINEGLILDKDLGRTIADFFDHHFVDLKEIEIKDEYLDIIPEIVARAQRSIVYGITDETITVATELIENYEFFRLLEKKTRKNVLVNYATTRGVNHALKHYKGDLHDRIIKLIESCSENEEGGDIVNLVDLFLEYANDNGASDIHIEPLEKYILIRFRIDGLLHEAVRYPGHLHDKIIFRLKIMSHMQPMSTRRLRMVGLNIITAKIMYLMCESQFYRLLMVKML